MPCPYRPGGLAVAAVTLALGLSGCGGSGETVGEALGYEQKGPDEMTVIKRPPLTVPPDFNLRPPRPGEPQSEADAASKAARETLIGPSSDLAPENPSVAPVNVASSSEVTRAGDRAKATLTGQEEDWQRFHKSPPLLPENGQAAEATVEAPPSAGQSALLSRSNRVERDLDALKETRDENRVDGALLRRLLAWQPAPTDPETADAGGVDRPKPGDIVKIVRREQTSVSTGISSE